MEQPRDAFSRGFTIARSALAQVSRGADVPTLNTAGSRKVEAWFLGTKGENGDEFERLILEAIRDHIFWRRNFHPGDPTHVSDEVKRSPEYLQAMDALKEGHQELLAFLKKSVPFFSMRYQGHMNWDLTIPGMLGYFSAMLYNPNNVAFEGSTATTILEQLVGDDLCRMLGYAVPGPGEDTGAALRPWGHITCDGTVANIEAIWACRNLKYYPLAFREALKSERDLARARGMAVKLPGGGEEKALTALSTWELLNLPLDDILALSSRLATEFGIVDRDTVTRAVGKYSLQNLGIAGFTQRFLNRQGVGDPVVFVPGSKHYSFPKAVALLGLGAANLINIPVDKDARQSLGAIRQQLELCLQEKRPVLTVVAVIGTTEESAIDPLEEILELRDEFGARGLAFPVHADAAWGGYHRSLLNDPFDLPRPRALAAAALAAPPYVAPLSAYATANLLALARADSITVDPHKSGYIPYPAGALCYRNSAMRDLVTFSAPVVFHGATEPTVGIYGIEGSKPGAAAAAVYLSHRVIRPTREGYGKIIGQALYSCRRLYARLLSLAGPDDPFIVVPVPRLPAERQGRPAAEVDAQRKRIAELIDRPGGGVSGASAPALVETGPGEFQGSDEAIALLREIGPDQNILSYAFNLRRPDRTLNGDLERANRLNRAIYDLLRIEPLTDIYGHDLIVSTTDFDAEAYGEEFIADFKQRLGIDRSPGRVITVLRSVVMNPWVTETTAGSFIDILGDLLRKAVLRAAGQLEGRTFRGY
jgi:glutamate/tyrosine decarboxylase-like PLP-dependent enzyme